MQSRSSRSFAIERISLPLARRIALAAQGFGGRRPDAPGGAHLRKLADRLHLFQIDSVNVLARAHYLPAYSRLGPYDRGALDRLAWGARREKKLFEYWAHEASLLAFEAHPLLRWRMQEADRGERCYGQMRVFATERRAEALALLDRIRAEGPLATADFEAHRGRSGWWEWSEVKRALEWLFWAGHITTATRKGSFARVYDLTERVIPAEIMALPTPSPAEAHRALIERAAAAHGIATEADLRDYFRLPANAARAAVETLAEEGVLIPVSVPGWGHVWLHRDARRPRRVAAQALLSPFDPLVWRRERAEKLFGFRYRIEIYVPQDKRTHGYYVLPFLLGERLVGRIDLKADRRASRLIARRASFEPDAPPHAAEALREELAAMAAWLGLEDVDADAVARARP